MEAPNPEGLPVIILDGEFAGREGVCLGRGPVEGTWAISADKSDKIVYLRFGEEFGILLNKGQDSGSN